MKALLCNKCQTVLNSEKFYHVTAVKCECGGFVCDTNEKEYDLCEECFNKMFDSVPQNTDDQNRY